MYVHTHMAVQQLRLQARAIMLHATIFAVIIKSRILLALLEWQPQSAPTDSTLRFHNTASTFTHVILPMAQPQSWPIGSGR